MGCSEDSSLLKATQYRLRSVSNLLPLLCTRTLLRTPTGRMQSIASKISGPPNMEAIPAAINNFKGQVFKGVINNGKGAPSTTRYPTEFGPAVNKLLADRQPSYDEVIGSLGSAMAAAGNNNTDVSSFFSSYASSVYSSATSFLSQWTGKTGVYTSTTSSTSSSGSSSQTATAATTTSKICSAALYSDFNSCTDHCYQGLCQENAGQPSITCSGCPSATPTAS